MAIFDFTAAQVLTAAQMDNLQANDYNQTVSTKVANYVLVAADKGTRVVMNAAGATTITVNTDLFAANDTLIIQNIGAGTCTVNAGTATVTASGSLALAQWAGATLYFTSASASILIGNGVSSLITKVDRFTVSGTFTPPTGATYAVAHILAGGGGASHSTNAGDGGNSSVAFAAGTITANGSGAANANRAPFLNKFIGTRPANSGQGAMGSQVQDTDRTAS